MGRKNGKPKKKKKASSIPNKKRSYQGKMDDEEQGMNSETRRKENGVFAWIRWLFLFGWLRRKDSRVVPTDTGLSRTKQDNIIDLQPIPNKPVTSSTVYTSTECDNEQVNEKYDKDLNDLQTKIIGLESHNQMHLRTEQHLSAKINHLQETATKYEEELKQLTDKLKIANEQLKGQAERHLAEIGQCNDSMKNKDLDIDARNLTIINLETDVSTQKRTMSNLKQNIKSLQKRIKMLENDKEQQIIMLNNKDRLINSLKDEKQKLEEEKQDALGRLSAMMSVKLRDNNPNIADLSDQFRPTKLGEQFSELYDNEWTDAFDTLQNKFEEKQAISILLDIIMESYQFCDQELLEVWTIAESWFIDKDAMTAQQISKTLKDGRKKKVIGRIHAIQQKYTVYLLNLCNTEHLDKFLTSDPLRNYISTCVRLALLMTANDPPVVIECPGWQRFSKRQHPRETASLSSSDDGLAPEDLNNDNENKSTINTIDETRSYVNDIKMKNYDEGNVDNICSNENKPNGDNPDSTLSNSVQEYGKDPLSDHNILNKTQTNGSTLGYLEGDVGKNKKEHFQESNNLKKTASELNAPPNVTFNFEPTDCTPEDKLANKIDEHEKVQDIPTDQVRIDTPHQTNDTDDRPKENMSVAESLQHHHADGQTSDAKFTGTGASLNERIEESDKTGNNVGNTTKIVLTNYGCNAGTDSAQSQVVDSLIDTDSNRDAPSDINGSSACTSSAQKTQSNTMDGLCQQLLGLSITHEVFTEISSAAVGDIVEDHTFDSKDGIMDSMSDEESCQHHDADRHTCDPSELLDSDAQLADTGDNLNIQHIEESEKTGSNLMIPNITQEAESPKDHNPNRDSPTNDKIVIQLPDKTDDGTESLQYQLVKEDLFDGQNNDADVSNTKDGSLDGASNVKYGQQQCAERDKVDDQTNGEHISHTKDGPTEDMSGTVHVSGQHERAMGNTHDSIVQLISDKKSTTTGMGLNDNHIEKSHQIENEVNHNFTTAAAGDSCDGPTKQRCNVERPIFDKDKFKEYTSRGPFVEYFVWPIMYLHQDGPMLGKGIAQGSTIKMDDGSNKLLVSWKKMT
ncbi:uncharacterized protein LOC127850673 [Dreissena polymorpha]|uniref:Mitochondria-eating protein n=1 Tax=Dreissena polymorpha TaxID=45954 RepID=A0A9D4D3Y4_DREPO|nr:uncharacterized protein LOC127850673 [Dreissena polymorpha]XP_052239831.1 uncharacterized protein LOC127850673 [Dreissena polymorpha]KAH3737729.1 hypothetical protein DPMN_044322 [Dreissena polymorpha]